MKEIKSSALAEMVRSAIRLEKPVAFAVSAKDDFSVLCNVVFLPAGTPYEVLNAISTFVGQITVANMRKQDFE